MSRASKFFTDGEKPEKTQKPEKFFQKGQEQVGITENGVNLRLREQDIPFDPRISFFHQGETVSYGVIGHQSTRGRQKNAAFPVVTEV